MPRADTHKTKELLETIDSYKIENDFVETVREYFEANGYVTQKQYDTMEEVLENYKVENDLL